MSSSLIVALPFSLLFISLAFIPPHFLSLSLSLRKPLSQRSDGRVFDLARRSMLIG